MPLVSVTSQSTCTNTWNSLNIAVFVDINSNLIFDPANDIMLRSMDIITANNKNDLFVHSESSAAVSFDGQGRIPNSQLGNLTFCPNGDNNQSITLNLSASGRVRNTGHDSSITCS